MPLAVSSPLPKRLLVRAARSVTGSAAYVALIFVGAGKIGWPRGVLFGALFVAVSLVGSLIIELCNAPLFAARAKGMRRDTKPFDRLFYVLFLPIMLLYPLMAGLDAGRLQWLPLPTAMLVVGVALFLAGSALSTWALVVNAHAEGTVRIQADRQHRVVIDGPYRFVRHPMYVGTIIGLPALALIVGSGMALIPAALIISLFVWRTGCEDTTLRRELPGYADYAGNTRYRLLPGVW